VKHQFTKDILLVNDAFDTGNELISLAESTGYFAPSLIANSENSGYIDNTRTNAAFYLDENNIKFSPYTTKLSEIVIKACDIYKSYNPFSYGIKLRGFDILRYSVGEKFDEHVDAIYGNKLFQNRQRSVLIYLNDDYEGGETRFIRQELQIKPPAGSLAMFPPFYTHPHSGEPVTKGTKYVVVGWLY